MQLKKKWQKKWQETNLYKTDLSFSNSSEKHYTLVMFSYPSGDKLHVGHWYNFGPTDTYARFQRMMGKKVFEPMGFDAFGLPAENYAIKTGIHPAISTRKNIEVMTEQLKAIGAMYDWDYKVVTCEPDYYRWSQWIFLEFFKKGLAYRAEAPVNWCPKDKTVLANEQVKDNCCERCGTPVIRKKLTQWFFKITEYAEELLEKLNDLDWPESTKAKQREWIGKSKGAEIEFSIDGFSKKIRVFTTRPDTLFGVTFITLAPELQLVQEISSAEHIVKVKQYISETEKRSELDRLSAVEKNRCFYGCLCDSSTNPRKDSYLDR